jgi:hypothetical protein
LKHFVSLFLFPSRAIRWSELIKNDKDEVDNCPNATAAASDELEYSESCVAKIETVYTY